MSDILMFYIKFLTIHKVNIHAGAIRQLMYGCAYVREIILPYMRTNNTTIDTCMSKTNVYPKIRRRQNRILSQW